MTRRFLFALPLAGAFAAARSLMPRRIKSGDHVRILDGPLRGCAAEYVRHDGDEAVLVVALDRYSVRVTMPTRLEFADAA